ncbi:MAG: hypothetical protein ACI9TY_001789 [Alphaproteobacteria bacterium]|jgi:hypothetical protein
MKKVIATVPGKPSKIVDLTVEEIDARNAEIARVEAEILAEAPYKRLDEIDIDLQSKLPRMIEDIKNASAFDVQVQALLDEKASIRLTLV